jgi:plasmid stabilization system protein ParE
MARVVVTELADEDVAAILGRIAREAGHGVATKYNFLIEGLYSRIAEYPEGFQSRPKLGPHIRVGIIYPYLALPGDLPPCARRRRCERRPCCRWTSQNQPQAFG